MKLTVVLMEPAPGGGDYSVRVDEAGHYYTFYRAPGEAEQAKVGDPVFHVGLDGRDSFAQAKWFIQRYVQGREEWRALKKAGPPVKRVGRAKDTLRRAMRPLENRHDAHASPVR